MLIDTHCHLDALEFDADRDDVIRRAQALGVAAIIIPAVSIANLDTVRDLAHSFPGGRYALGIHPICVPAAQESHLADLESAIQAALSDSRLVAIGEIGLDYFIPELARPAMRQKQELFYTAQLDLAQRYGLPVIIHVRRSHDILLKHLRRRPHIGGIAHAFNGSAQQAQQFIDLGFALGFGGAMTFDRALQIRRLAQSLDLDHLVLETDAPDIPPAWLGLTEQGDRDKLAGRRRNEPAEVARMAEVLADLRGITREQVLEATWRNALRVLPRLGTLVD
ncbi:MAG: TatD family hydrolase [Burkholderiaceae bacterium]|nr:TatD family hydrolase [Burkholderiaceae bacterium]